jgi:hypothetical protein
LSLISVVAIMSGGKIFLGFNSGCQDLFHRHILLFFLNRSPENSIYTYKERLFILPRSCFDGGGCHIDVREGSEVLRRDAVALPFLTRVIE